MSDAATRRVGVNVGLYVLAMVAAALVVVGSVLVWRDHHHSGVPAALPQAGAVPVDEGSTADQERYAAIIASARTESTAFVNIDYRDISTSLDAVRNGATGQFRQQYDKSTSSIVKLLQQNRSVMKGTVLWTGVVGTDQDSATVVVATTGTVANVNTKNKPIARNYRLQLDLVLEGGRWLTSDLQFVS